mgnify:CR=1 FL=1
MGKIKHGHTGNSGKFLSPTYLSWMSMKQRCLNPNHTAYARYGGKGITLCDDWSNFINFLSDMGERQPGTSLDRIDGLRGYSKENCRWATQKEQSDNRYKNFTYKVYPKRILRPKCSEIDGIPDLNRKYLIKWFRAKGCTIKSIGKYFGISHQRVSKIDS